MRLVGPDETPDIEAMLSGLTRRIFRGRCAVLFDTTETVHRTIHQAQETVRLEARWLRANHALIERNVVGVGFVITHPAVRFALSSVLVVAPLPVPHLVTGDVDEGRFYCLQQLRAPSLRP